MFWVGFFLRKSLEELVIEKRIFFGSDFVEHFLSLLKVVGAFLQVYPAILLLPKARIPPAFFEFRLFVDNQLVVFQLIFSILDFFEEFQIIWVSEPLVLVILH